MSEEMRLPRVESNGVPYCAKDDCPMYDGKRCRELGLRPDGICEPEVSSQARELRTLRAAMPTAEEREALAWARRHVQSVANATAAFTPPTLAQLALAALDKLTKGGA